MIKIVILAFVILLLSWAGGMVKKEYSVLLGLCGMVLIFSIGLKELSRWFQGMSSFWQEIDSLAPYIKILLKMAGISYLSQFAVNACKNAGQQGLAGQVGFFGKISMLLCSVPLLQTLWETMSSLLQKGG